MASYNYISIDQGNAFKAKTFRDYPHPDLGSIKKLGLDISKHNGDVDFNLIKKAGVSYVILRAGYGKIAGQKDSKFDVNYARAKEAGLNVGAYWYSYAESTIDVEMEANACLSVIAGKKFEYPIYFDLEESRQFKLGSIFCTNCVNLFCDMLETNGYFAGLYMSKSPMIQYISPETRKKYALWVAQYASKCTYPEPYGMWQFSPNGMLMGHNVWFDLNECNVDYPSIMKSRGLNGYTKPAPTSDKPAKEDKYRYMAVADIFDTYEEAIAKVREIEKDQPNACVKKILK